MTVTLSIRNGQPDSRGSYRRYLLVFLMAGVPLVGQMPDGWMDRQILGADVPKGVMWGGVGTWSAQQRGPSATLISSLGFGNSLVGHGIFLEGGRSGESWSFAFKGLGFRDAEGASAITLHQGHITWRTKGLWEFGLEKEPLVWGYGITGGYLLGESARPFPRLRISSPATPVDLWGISLGTWGFQWFTGRLENRRALADNVQDRSRRSRLIEANGEPEAPLFSGYRAEATFLEERIESYLNWTVLWAGNRRGVGMTSGYSLGEYLTAMTGTKDPLAETSIDFSDPNRPAAQLVNGAQSSTNFDMGIRFHLTPLARLFSADRVQGYISRGSKGVTLGWGVLAKRPIYWLGKDLEKEIRYALRSDFRGSWYNTENHVAPNLIAPNDVFGLLIRWPSIRLGVERRNTQNDPSISYRSFGNDTYAVGFYRDGDPLGEALGGEALTTTIRLECDFHAGLMTTFWFLRGTRPFRDRPDLWLMDHPGKVWQEDRFTGLQGDLQWKVNSARALRAGFAWERHASAHYVLGNGGNGFRWFAEFSARWFR